MEDKFIFQNGLNDDGCEILKSYQLYHSKNVETLYKKALIALAEKKIKNAEYLFTSLSEHKFYETLMKDKKFVKQSKDRLYDAVEYIDSIVSTDTIRLIIVVDTRARKLYVRKMIGISATDAARIFGVTHEKALQYFRQKDFIKEFVDTYVRKRTQNYINKHAKNGAVVTISDVYFVDGRNLCDINVDYLVNVDNLDKNMCLDIEEFMAGLQQPVTFMQ